MSMCLIVLVSNINVFLIVLVLMCLILLVQHQCVSNSVSVSVKYQCVSNSVEGKWPVIPPLQETTVSI